MRVCHNIATASEFNPEQGQYLHMIKCVISDLGGEAPVDDKADMAQRQILHSQEFRINVQPMLEPHQFVEALRLYADSLEKYLAEVPEKTDAVG